MTVLKFPGNEPGETVSIPTPTRAALILSAKQWATAARERAYELSNAGTDGVEYIESCMDHVMRILGELEIKK